MTCYCSAGGDATTTVSMRALAVLGAPAAVARFFYRELRCGRARHQRHVRKGSSRVVAALLPNPPDRSRYRTSCGASQPHQRVHIGDRLDDRGRLLTTTEDRAGSTRTEAH
jgi:hypothetical protein